MEKHLYYDGNLYNLSKYVAIMFNGSNTVVLFDDDEQLKIEGNKVAILKGFICYGTGTVLEL